MNDMETLKKLFDFTDEDLATNRVGKLSERQRAHYQQRLVTENINRAAMMFTFVMFLVTLVIFLAFNLQYGDQLGPLVLVGIVIWLGLVYALSRVISKLASVMIQQAERDPTQGIVRIVGRLNPKQEQVLETGTIQRATGRLRFRTDGEHSYVMLGNVELSSNVSADKDERLWELQPDKAYTVFYISDPLWVMAVDPH